MAPTFPLPSESIGDHGVKIRRSPEHSRPIISPILSRHFQLSRFPENGKLKWRTGKRERPRSQIPALMFLRGVRARALLAHTGRRARQHERWPMPRVTWPIALRPRPKAPAAPGMGWEFCRADLPVSRRRRARAAQTKPAAGQSRSSILRYGAEAGSPTPPSRCRGQGGPVARPCGCAVRCIFRAPPGWRYRRPRLRRDRPSSAAPWQSW